MTSHFSNTKKYTPLTEEMIEQVPLVDIHVHLAGTISPETAWALGVLNKLITITTDIDGNKIWENGPKSLSIDNPHEHYSDIFKQNVQSGITLSQNGLPENLEYNIDPQSFKSFDRVMATIQGHRHPPGGIQRECDLEFVLERYLHDCIMQKVVYTEVQQNIKIAYQLYPDASQKEARALLYKFLARTIKFFKKYGVELRFLHCFNKTQAAGLDSTGHERALEAAEWLKEAQETCPGVFVGIESAGHEKDETGWPIHLQAGYEKVKELGLGCESHGGEGIGVEHMIDVIKILPITRLAHGFQAVEDEEAIRILHEKNITLIMMPIINLNLGACLHGIENERGDFIAMSKTRGGKKIFITELHKHPFFTLMRKHKLKVTIGSDNPHLGGAPLKKMIMALAGISSDHLFPLPEKDAPLTAEELIHCCLHGIEAAFCESAVKLKYKKQLKEWADKYNLKY